MQYRVKKRIGGACIVCGIILGVAFVFIFLDGMDAGIKAVNRASWCALMLLSLLLVSRFIFFEHIYQINDRGFPCRFEIFVASSKRSRRLVFINLIGAEELYRCSKSTKPLYKSVKNMGNYVSNMFAREKYCLVFEENGEKRRIFIECDDFFASALSSALKGLKTDPADNDDEEPRQESVSTMEKKTPAARQKRRRQTGQAKIREKTDG